MRSRVQSRRLGEAVLAVILLVCSSAQAETAAPVDAEARAEVAERRVERARAEVSEQNYFHWFSVLSMGRGLRFNNPYRLERVLGDSSESASLSALYLDAELGVAQGDPSGIQHGVSVDLGLALTGIRQEVLTPSYRLLFRPPSAWLWSARLGFPLVLEPDVTAGVELGVSSVYRVLAHLGICLELIGSLFFGAATLDRDTSVIPIVATELGVWGQYEVFE